MLIQLKQLLEHLENSLDERKIASIENLHKDALCHKDIPRLPVITSYPYPEDAQFQPFPHGQIFDDPEKMLFNQFLSAFGTSIYLSEKVGDDLPYTIRADFGCVLVASMFGATVEQVGDNPPWIRHGQNEITYEQIIQRFNGGLKMDLISDVISRYKFYQDVLADYPRLSKITNITLPDMQGPFDNLELIRGSDVFIDMHINRRSFLETMSVVTDAQIEIANRFFPFVNETQPEFSHQHGFPLKGGILIRNDTSIMVSPAMYREMIAPFDERILGRFGGGIHSCGQVDRIVPEYLSMKSISCFDFGQSELNDVQAIYKLAQRHKVALTRVAVTEEELSGGTIINKYPTGVNLIFRAKSFEHARQVIADYKRAYSG